MEYNLNDLYQCLLLTEEENEEVVVEPDKLENALLCGGKCLILKLFTDKHCNKEMFKLR